MAMTLREQNALLNKIVWGGFYTRVENANKETLFLVIKELNLKDRAWVDFIHQQAILEGKDSGLMPQGELAIFLSRQGTWTDRDEKELKDLTDGLERLDGRLTEPLTRHEEKKVKRAHDLVRLTHRELQNRKSELFASSLERYADELRLKAIVYSSVRNIDDTRYWQTWGDFENETDSRLIENVISEIAKSTDITTEQFRYIARSGSWRFKWQASKNCDDLFGKPIVELSGSQENLIYWSQVYDSVYEAYERPDDDIIDDDEALDEWFNDQSKKRKAEDVERKSQSKSSSVGSQKVWRHGEVGIVVNEGLQGDLERAEKLGLAAKKQTTMTPEEVNDLNSELSKKFKKSQRNKLKEHGVLREEDIRNDPNSRRAISSTDAIVKKQRRPDGFTGRTATKTFQGGTLQGRREDDK